MNTHFKLFANCILTQGVKRSIISDIQIEKINIIPNDLGAVINLLNSGKSIEEVICKSGLENKTIIKEYIYYLLEEDLGFYCSKKEFNSFPKIDETYTTPQIITNAVIELKGDNISDLKNITFELEELGCENTALVFYESLHMDAFNKLVEIHNDSSITAVEITLKYNPTYTPEFLEELSAKFHRITRLLIFDSPYEESYNWGDKILFSAVFTKKNISSFKSCGIVNTSYFSINTTSYFEAKKHNSCLHKKIAIDLEGNIKNCPAMQISYGNIKDTSLTEVIHKKNFQKLWNINKDQIKTCKDCEFRYVCIDCRAFLENPEDDTSKPLKCGYNPYTNQWEEWSNNPIKKQAISYYGLEESINTHSS